jgi:hypothetical protein
MLWVSPSLSRAVFGKLMSCRSQPSSGASGSGATNDADTAVQQIDVRAATPYLAFHSPTIAFSSTLSKRMGGQF